jgi:hypothetical protein
MAPRPMKPSFIAHPASHPLAQMMTRENLVEGNRKML